MATHFNYKTIIFLLAASMGYQEVYSQADLTFNGLGRGIITNNNLSGNILNGDTASRRKGLSGYNLFDLSVGFSKGKEFKSNIILRLRQPFGEFWGQATTFEFRQLQIMGDLKSISYGIGDIDVQMTPYTVFNPGELQNYHGMESEIFKARRDIVQYENFNRGNVWRLQGVKLGSARYLNSKFIEQILVKGFGVRTNATNDVNIPDRVLTGLSVHAFSEDRLNAGINYTGYLDIPLSDFATNYRNNVITGEINYRIINNEGFKLNIKGEGGISDYTFYKKSTNSTAKANDFFADGGVKAEVKNGITFGLSYKNVGAKFSSPSAQTTRLNLTSNPLLFSPILNNTTNRPQILFDRFTQEQIYNRGISPALQTNYTPYFNNINPYGEATPNRQGFTFDMNTKDSSAINMVARARYFTEVVGEGSTFKRNFIAANAGMKISLNKLLNFEKAFVLTFGGRMEKTKRGDNSVDLTSTLIDGGIMYRIDESLDLMAGVKFLTANGKEIIGIRNDLNSFSGYNGINVKLTQNIIAFGFRVNFNPTTNFLVNYNMVAQKDKLNDNLSYNINQLFMNFNIMF
jgi:hypothetical protein